MRTLRTERMQLNSEEITDLQCVRSDEQAVDGCCCECDEAPMRSSLLLLMLTGCKDDCVQMCQRIDNWLTECGYTWESTFEEEEWTSIDDCYENYTDATSEKEKVCIRRAHEWDAKECY